MTIPKDHTERYREDSKPEYTISVTSSIHGFHVFLNGTGLATFNDPHTDPITEAYNLLLNLTVALDRILGYVEYGE